MEKKWILVIAIMIFIAFTFLILSLGSVYYKKEYGTKMWKQWPTRLYNWQAAIFYSLILTTITMYLLKWANVIDF